MLPVCEFLQNVSSHDALQMSFAFILSYEAHVAQRRGFYTLGDGAGSRGALLQSDGRKSFWLDEGNILFSHRGQIQKVI